MDKFLTNIDWQSVFVPSISLLEIFVRGTLVYLMLFLFLRFFLNRETGAIGIADIIVLVLIADAAQNAMASNYNSITEGTVLVATIIFWNYLLDWLGYRFSIFRRLVRPAPLLLVKDGRMIRQNMKKELITDEELLSQLREQGIENITKVKKAYMEGDGHISVISYDDKHQHKKETETVVK
jgi:uncharacterized membrane protein YcaP (DUF421 family)